ncbi:MAG: MucBP domain-containing protein, partial [Bacilli bacterium]|nr:MucBP domain-containing protein [Bacilli bacterium]
IVEASVSSETADKGYAIITQTSTTPTSTTGNFMNISGTKANAPYQSAKLQGGKKYYLHFKYTKDGSVDTGEDRVKINSVKVYQVTTTTENYYFETEEGKYVSNNQGQINKVANSYIPIDLTAYKGKYNIIINAEISASTTDYGYATITTTTTAPTYSNTTGRFMYINGTTEAQDYTTMLEGGKKYYLHLGYKKGNTIPTNAQDKLTINNIQMALNLEDRYITEVTTNEKGEANVQLPIAKYTIEEIEAPEGYVKADNIVYEMKTDEENHITIQNKKQANIIVHHYKDGTTQKIAEDETTIGQGGENYTTAPKQDLSEYELKKDENGEYIIPENATGEYVDDETIEIIYYYVEKEIPITVNHYIEGTITPVPLKDGTQANSQKATGKTGQEYRTTAITPENLNEKYELVEEPENKNGTIQKEEIIVNYYYKVKQVQIITNVQPHEETNEQGETIQVKGGSILGEGQTPYETIDYLENSQKDIIITPDDGYKVSGITVNGVEVEFTANTDKTVEIAKFENMIENKEIIVSFEKITT